MRYAVFPGTRRLAVARNGTVTIYDTGQHRIGGASQAQSGDQSLSFSSQLGPVRLADLPVVGGPTRAATGATAPAATSVGAAAAKSGTPAPAASQPVPVPPASEPAFGAAPGPATSGGGDVLCDDRAPRRARVARDPDRGRVRAEEGRAPRPALGRAAACGRHRRGPFKLLKGDGKIPPCPRLPQSVRGDIPVAGR